MSLGNGAFSGSAQRRQKIVSAVIAAVLGPDAHALCMDDPKDRDFMELIIRRAFDQLEII